MSDSEPTGRGGLTPFFDVIGEPQPRGRLEWMVSDRLGNLDVLTVGNVGNEHAAFVIDSDIATREAFGE